MRKSIIFSAFAVLFVTTTIFSQDEQAIQDTDYEYFTETEEIGSGYTVVSYYLKNISEFRIVFFNFSINADPGEYTFVKSLPDDILILDPHRSNKFSTLKIVKDNPPITWHARKLFPSVGYNKFPENGKNYIFFWESEIKGSNLEYSYFLKNICDRRMKFFDFSLTEVQGLQPIMEIPAVPVYLWPDSTYSIVRFSVPDKGNTPELNWQALFTNFQPTGDDFCNELIKIFEASGESDFSPVKRTGSSSSEFLCNIKVPGLNDERIIYEGDKWFFTAQIGGPGLKKEIDTRFRNYFERIDLCIPDIIPIQVVKSKASKNKTAAFSGIVDNKKHSGQLQVRGDLAQPDNYSLHLLIFAAE